jgi:hypothetical protein
MTKDEFIRLKRLLNAVAEKQKAVADNMLKAERRFVVTERAIADLLSATKKRITNE